jgi:uncharacterized protein YdaU (DUF1376 family)
MPRVMGFAMLPNGLFYLGGIEMGKDPAFLFYPNDYIGGTMGMTFEEKGAYVELLMMQFNRGHMSEHMIGQTVGQLWENLKDKFCQDEKGLWYNVRLDEEKLKRQSYTESRKKNIQGINQYTKNKQKEEGHVSGHMTPHMENENVNENINDNKVVRAKKFIVPKIDEIRDYCNERGNYVDAGKFYDFYESKGWMIGKNKMKDWKAAVRNWERDKPSANMDAGENYKFR